MTDGNQARWLLLAVAGVVTKFEKTILMNRQRMCKQ